MKKKILSLMLVLMLGCMMTGCGKDEPAADSTEAAQSEVTLGTYKGIEVTVAPVEVNQLSVNNMVTTAYNSVVTAENGGITDRAVANGDTVNIDFVGKKDDVAFEGGTSYGYNLSIGSGQFIAGFEEGLVGVMPGETVDLNLTFPADYGNEELKGAAVVFTVTVNYILPTEEDWQDSVVTAIGIEGVNTVQGLRDYAYNYYYNNALNNYNIAVENSVLQSLLDHSEFGELPQKELDRYIVIANKLMEQNATSYGMTAADFCAAYYGMDLADYANQYSESTVKQELALHEVARRENLLVSDEELETILAQEAAAAGVQTVEEFLGQATKEDYRDYLNCERALQFMVENAVINNE